MKKPGIRKLFNRLRFSHRRDGPYRFLIRNWSGINDINIIAGALSAETFRANVRPAALPVKQARSIVVLAPHQDDELIGAGGLMLKARDAGIALTVVFVTDGAQNNLHFNGRDHSPEEIVKIRESEARAVCEKLKARYECLGVDNISMNMELSHIAGLKRILQDSKADLVLTPWLFDGSPKHRAVNQLLMYACQDVSGVREVWGYQVNNTPFANGYVDISKWLEEKIALLELYKSQNEGIRRYEHMARGLNAWNSRFLPSKKGEQNGAYAEIFFAVPRDEYCELVKTYYPGDIEKTYFGNKRLIAAMGKLSREVE